MKPYNPAEVIVSHDDFAERKQNAKELYGKRWNFYIGVGLFAGLFVWIIVTRLMPMSEAVSILVLGFFLAGFSLPAWLWCLPKCRELKLTYLFAMLRNFVALITIWCITAAACGLGDSRVTNLTWIACISLFALVEYLLEKRRLEAPVSRSTLLLILFCLISSSILLVGSVLRLQ